MEASREHYQTLRAMISHVIARCPENQSDVGEKLTTARAVVGDMHNIVRSRGGRNISGRDRSQFNESLNAIQSDLEELASNVGFVDSQGEMR